MILPTPNYDRRSSVRERRILKLLCALMPSRWRHVERRWAMKVEAARKPKPAPEPRHPSRIGAREWEERVLSLGSKPPSCLDRKELALPEDGPTRCCRTGLVLLRGRCPECTCKPI